MPLRPVAAVSLAFLVLLGAGPALAQQTWPTMPLEASGWRGPGFYLSWMKIAACWLVFLAWVRTTDWAHSDAYLHKLPYVRWNAILVGSFLAAFVLVWLLPVFWLGFPLLVAAYAGPLAAYIHFRNGALDPSQGVLTPEHFRFLLSQKLSTVGVKIAAERPDPHETGPVKLLARGGPTPADENVRLLAARQTPGYDRARQLLAAALARRATAVMLDCGGQSVSVKQLIDGVWFEATPLVTDDAQAAIDTLKVLAGLNPAKPRPREEGRFGLEYESEGYLGTLASQAAANQTRVVIQWEGKPTRFADLEALGMRPKMQEQLQELLALSHGLVLFSAMPASGLRTTVDVTLRSLDRMLRDFASLEDESRRYAEVENILVTTYQGADNAAEALARLMRTDPQVVVVRDLPNAEVVRILAQHAVDDRMVLATMRSKDAAEALLRILALKASPAEVAQSVTAVLAQRLIRKLCEHCKEAYVPPAPVLQQLGIPPGRISAFFRPPENPEKPCRFCSGTGYMGRTAIYELLVPDDGFRKLLRAGAKLDALREAARRSGTPNLQDEGVLLVAKGVTSIPELVRVLKG
jgi:type II secretory ATPase GspE/PulE/Tfp pilus assembly ATPase PilB-like protein